MQSRAATMVAAMLLLLLLPMASIVVTMRAANTNSLYSPCSDTKIQRSDGFTFGIAFSSKNSFFLNGNQSHQLSPCDHRLSLSSAKSQLALFRPKVDEISLLTINTSSFQLDSYGGYMVAFAGRKYAARSLPAFVANSTYIVTSFTLKPKNQTPAQSIQNPCLPFQFLVTAAATEAQQELTIFFLSWSHPGSQHEASLRRQAGQDKFENHELFLWFPVKGIRVDVPSSGLIYFNVGVIDEQFPFVYSKRRYHEWNRGTQAIRFSLNLSGAAAISTVWKKIHRRR